MEGHPDELEALISYISISRNLERVADHATNIAEDVIALLEGEIVRHRLEHFDQDTNREMEQQE
jgi:phosphate transport system protein